MRSERLKGHLDLLLLSVLSRGPGHGYEVITRPAVLTCAAPRQVNACAPDSVTPSE